MQQIQTPLNLTAYTKNGSKQLQTTNLMIQIVELTLNKAESIIKCNRNNQKHRITSSTLIIIETMKLELTNFSSQLKIERFGRLAYLWIGKWLPKLHFVYQPTH